jgi:hypothetical protein
MKNLQFTVEEKQLIVEALLFMSVTDVCSEHTQVHRLKMIELAEKLNTNLGKLHNIYLFKTLAEEPIEPETQLVLSKFKNLPQQDIIEDR